MHSSRWHWWTMGLALLLVGCGTAAPPTSSTASPVNGFIQSEDCTIGVGAQAWVDENADGKRDWGEDPLAGVTLVVNEQQRRQPSNPEGTMLVVSLGACGPSDEAAVLTVEPPPGFMPTTSQPVTTTFQSTSRQVGAVTTSVVSSGFRPTP